MISYGWPDIIIVTAAAVNAVRGWKLGFINELAGTIAVAVGLYAAFAYPGTWDSFLTFWMHLQHDSAHVVAMFLFALLAYGTVVLIANVLDRYATSPIIRPINCIGGSILGIAKALLLFWFILYIALFLPMSRSLRSDLRSSFLVNMLTSQSQKIDAEIRPNTPWFARPFISPYLRKHHL